MDIASELFNPLFIWVLFRFWKNKAGNAKTWLFLLKTVYVQSYVLWLGHLAHLFTTRAAWTQSSQKPFSIGNTLSDSNAQTTRHFIVMFSFLNVSNLCTTLQFTRFSEILLLLQTVNIHTALHPLLPVALGILMIASIINWSVSF